MPQNYDFWGFKNPTKISDHKAFLDKIKGAAEIAWPFPPWGGVLDFFAPEHKIPAPS